MRVVLVVVVEKGVVAEVGLVVVRC